jgi:Zn-dependent protease with chaperone function
MSADIPTTKTPPCSGAGHYFDGRSSARHDVDVEIADTALLIKDRTGLMIAQWPYATLEQIATSDGLLRLGNGDRDNLARLEVRDPDFAAAIDDIATTVDRTGVQEKRMRRKVVLLSVGALIAVAAVSLIALPAIVTGLVPIMPVGLERKLGDAVDTQFRAMTNGASTPFECGTASTETAGHAAFDNLFVRLVKAANLPEDLRPAVIRRPEVNAIALPGGRIYVFEGLIDKAESADELAGVIAHEMGHVARRDGLRSVLESAGLSFFFGMLFGDFVGGGAVMIAARTVLHASYSRDTEAAADRYGVALMNAAGGNALGLAALLARIGDTHQDSSILSDHPQTKDRVAAIRALASAPPQTPLMSTADWAAIKSICSGR